MIVFVVGAPGVGKTTLLQSLLDDFTTYTIEKPKWTVSSPFALVGHYDHRTFGGGDTLGYTQGEEAVAYMYDELKSPPLRYFFLDGDRMSTKAVLKQVEEQGDAPYCVHLTADDEALAERCAKRGSQQNPTWAKGRKSKARNFANLFPTERRFEINTTGLNEAEVRNMFMEFLGYCEGCECDPCDCGWGTS